MQKIKVSAVSYLNSSPFIYGINHSDIKNDIEMSLDIPAICSDKLINNEVDLGLIPVAEIESLKESYIISDYCISAKGNVNSVLLLSDVPLAEIKIILLDYQSRTSVQLVKILASEYWKIYPEFKAAYKGYEEHIDGTAAGLVIGDRALEMKKKFKYAFDLSQAWFEMTSLPFVFACWVSNKKLSDEFIQNFNEALKYGVNHIDDFISETSNHELPREEIKKYLKENINYACDDEKKKAMELFFSFLKKENKLNV